MTADLIARMETATGGSRELDLEILCEMDGVPKESRCTGDVAPPYTTSLDAALTLVEPGGLWVAGFMDMGAFARYCAPMPDGGYVGGYQEIYAATPALALAIVALKARQEAGIAQD